MKTKTKSQKGLTIIELMIAAMAVAIVILAAGIVIIIGQTSWNRTWRDVNLQRDASYAMLLMARSIQAATDANAPAASNGRILYIPKQSDPNVITFSYLPDSNNLQCQVGGGETQTIISGTVNNLQFSVVDKNKVTIDLRLKKDGAQTRLVSTVMMRNYGS